jgi:hypothetical protein
MRTPKYFKRYDEFFFFFNVIDITLILMNMSLTYIYYVIHLDIYVVDVYILCI